MGIETHHPIPTVYPTPTPPNPSSSHEIVTYRATQAGWRQSPRPQQWKALNHPAPTGCYCNQACVVMYGYFPKLRTPPRTNVAEPGNHAQVSHRLGH